MLADILDKQMVELGELYPRNGYRLLSDVAN